MLRHVYLDQRRACGECFYQSNNRCEIGKEEQMRKIYILTVCFMCALLHAQTPGISVRTISNYNTWGWDAVVMQNNLY